MRDGAATSSIGVVVFGFDQGLVGQFNEAVAAFALEAVEASSGSVQVWAVVNAWRPPCGYWNDALQGLRGTELCEAHRSFGWGIQAETETNPGPFAVAELHLFYNRPMSGSIYASVRQRLLPLDESWRRHDA